jgi:glycosyltransferase involved in cell wall biosynthesis
MEILFSGYKIMQLTLIIHSLSAGGAERVMSIMANYWVKKGWQITLLTFNDITTPPFYTLDSRIVHIPLGIASQSPNPIIGIWKNLQRIQILRAAISASKPNAVISFLDTTNILTLLATRGLNIAVLVSERNEPGKYQTRVWQQLRHWIYPFADKIIVQTERAKKHFYSNLESYISVIYNPVLLPPYNKDTFSEQLLNEKSLIAIGRLEQQKGFDLLLRAFEQLKDTYADWKLTILGEGSLRAELETLRNQLGLAQRVHLPGRVKNPYEFLHQADIFVMSSRFEGFPNALCEAMASGLPVISTDCPCGPREIIRHEVDGILVPNEDVSALAAAMARLMSNKGERKRLAARAPEVTKRFSLEKVMGIWETVISEVIKKN